MSKPKVLDAEVKEDNHEKNAIKFRKRSVVKKSRKNICKNILFNSEELDSPSLSKSIHENHLSKKNHFLRHVVSLDKSDSSMESL